MKTKEELSEFFSMVAGYLFFIGGLGGWLLFSMLSKKWIAVVAYICALPFILIIACNTIRGFEQIKFKRFWIFCVLSLAVGSVFYVINRGNLGGIPTVFGAVIIIAYFGWILFSVIGVIEGWKGKAIAIVCIVFAVVAFFLFKTPVVKVECEHLTEVADISMFEGMVPPLIKTDVLALKGSPSDIVVEMEEEEVTSGYYDENTHYIEYEVMTLVYEKKGGTLEVVFTDKDYEDGYLIYFPNGLHVLDFLTDASVLKKEYDKRYRISIYAQNESELFVWVGKDNLIEEIQYY